MLIHLAIKVGKDENLLETLSHRVRCSTIERRKASEKKNNRQSKKAGNYYATTIREKFTKLICNKRQESRKCTEKQRGIKYSIKKLTL